MSSTKYIRRTLAAAIAIGLGAVSNDIAALDLGLPTLPVLSQAVGDAGSGAADAVATAPTLPTLPTLPSVSVDAGGDGQGSIYATVEVSGGAGGLPTLDIGSVPTVGELAQPVGELVGGVAGAGLSVWGAGVRVGVACERASFLGESNVDGVIPGFGPQPPSQALAPFAGNGAAICEFE